jgi:hypothetical protein
MCGLSLVIVIVEPGVRAGDAPRSATVCIIVSPRWAGSGAAAVAALGCRQPGSPSAEGDSLHAPTVACHGRFLQTLFLHPPIVRLRGRDKRLTFVSVDEKTIEERATCGSLLSMP